MPDLFRRIVLYAPVLDVTIVLFVIQTPRTFFWTCTVTLAAHAVYPSVTMTCPRATRASLSRRVMLRA